MPNIKKRRTYNLLQVITAGILTAIIGLVIDMQPIQAVAIFIILLIYGKLESIDARVKMR